MQLALNPGRDAPICWQEVGCPHCNIDRFEPVLEADDVLASGLRFLIVRCAGCGLCYTNPRPDPASMRRFYPANYHCHQRKQPSRRADPMERWLPSSKGCLLDFGCGAGAFLLRMRERGWDVAGVESADRVAHHLRAEHGLPVHAGPLAQSGWSAGSFDAITMRQSLEHVPYPLEVLHSAHALLSNGGRLLVSVPNFTGLPAYWFGADWYGLDLPRHLTHFTPATLHTMLTTAGFANVRIRHESHPSWIRHSAQRRGPRVLTARLASGLASRWARFRGRAEGVLAIADK
jgi:SAM-dependent methyltransferase